MPFRRATWGSPSAIARARSSVAGSAASVPAAPVSTSTIRPGCSVWVGRSSPHTVAAARSRSAPGSTATARRVATTRREEPSPFSSSHLRTWCSTCSAVSWTAVGTSVPPGVTGSTTVAGSQASVAAGAAASRHSTWKSLGSVRRASRGRRVSESTESTSTPLPSATSRRALPEPSGEIRTRSRDAPLRARRTPAQENGTIVPGCSRTSGCSTASRSAGCTPKGPGSSRSATSASRSSPCRQTCSRLRNAGPYSRPRPASSSYQAARSCGVAPGGGHASVATAASSGPAAETTPVAWSCHASSAVPRTRPWTRTARRPASSGAAAVSWTSTSSRSGTTSGVCSVSLSTVSPTRSAMSSRAVPGTTALPSTRWSVSQGLDRSEMRSVRTVPAPSASSTACPRSGWSAVASSQWRVRWKAYVGRSARGASANSRSQSTPTPCVHTSATEARNRVGPPSSRRSDPQTAAACAAPRSSRISWMLMVSTGWELTSMNVSWPCSASAATAEWKCTVLRRLRYQ
ncbi:hypothetical protein SALBM135S_09605 [Streptomyces alboniger]